jgi:glycosyltransferase involved in cell wall biosynthesis
MKKLAVLMPTYNAALYLKDSIDSVLNQTFRDFDLFIYDDCSTDDTEDCIAQYVDERVFYRKNSSNLGIAKTLNLGLESLLPHYEYIARMDADDWCFPERFKMQLEHLENNPKTVLCGTQGYWLKDLELNPKKGWTYPTDSTYIQYYLLFGATFGHSSIVLRSQSFINFDLKYDETVKTCEDWEFWGRVAKVGQMMNLPDFLMKYRIVETSNHRADSKIKLHLVERSKIISNYWSLFGFKVNSVEVYDFYYGNAKYSNIEFFKNLKKWIHLFNSLYEKARIELAEGDKNQFSYLLCRRVLDFWKRSGKGRWNFLVWIMIVRELKVTTQLKLIKSIIR